MSINKEVALKTVYKEREAVWGSMSEQEKRSTEACCWDDGFTAGFKAAQEYFRRTARA